MDFNMQFEVIDPFDPSTLNWEDLTEYQKELTVEIGEISSRGIITL